MLRLHSRPQTPVSACCVSDAIKGNIMIKASTSDGESGQDRQRFVDHQPYRLLLHQLASARLADVRFPAVTPAVVHRVCGL